MKKNILSLILIFLCSITFAQQKEEAEKLVDEGVADHDKGDYEGALSKYDKALMLDKDNIIALTEKALTLLSMEKFENSIKICQLAIDKHPDDKGLKNIYVNYGNAYDGLKKTDKSIEIYDEGIKKFPDYYQLYFNKGISLASVRKYDDAEQCFQKSVSLNPRHIGSHNALARVLDVNKMRIASLLAYGRFFIL